jgi:hypothetical protein
VADDRAEFDAPQRQTPKERLYAIYMVQANAADTRELRLQFRSMVQAALLN